MVGASKPEDMDVGPDVGNDDEMFETGPVAAGPKFGTDAGGGAVVTVAIIVGASVGVETVEMVGVDDVEEIPALATVEATADIGEVTDGILLVGEESV